MKDRISRLIVFIAAVLLTAETIQAQGTAFNYQVWLDVPDGSYDFTFTLYDSASNLVAGPLTNDAVAVTNGSFTTTLDFGSGVFTGNPLWLEIGVETNGIGPFETLSPRQQLLPVPYAIFASTAGQLTGYALQQVDYESQIVANNTVNAATNAFAGTVSSIVQSATNNFGTTVPVNLTNEANQFAGTFSGNGSGLTNIPEGVVRLIKPNGYATNWFGSTPTQRGTAFMNAIANQSTNDIILFNGVCDLGVINSGLKLKPGVTLRGMGSSQSILKADGDFVELLTAISNNTLIGFTVSNYFTGEGQALVIGGNTYLSDVEADGDFDCFSVVSPGTTILNNCRAFGKYDAFVITAPQTIYMNDCRFHIVASVGEASSTCLRDGNTTAYNVGSLFANNCVFQMDPDGWGVNNISFKATNTSSITLKNCTIQNIGSSGSMTDILHQGTSRLIVDSATIFNAANCIGTIIYTNIYGYSPSAAFLNSIQGNGIGLTNLSTTNLVGQLTNNTTGNAATATTATGISGGALITVTNVVNSQNYVTATITNGLATTNYVINATKNLGTTVPVNLTNEANQFAGTFSGNGIGMTNIQTANIIGLPSDIYAAFMSSTNVFNQKVKFVGGTPNASDLNTGGMYDPWLTIAHAQANTPPGWTIAVMSGVHSTAGEYATNNAVNWYVNTGAYVVLYWLHPGTNIVYGNGELELTDWHHPWGSNVVCNITCNNCCPNGTTFTDGDYITIDCLDWGITDKVIPGKLATFLYGGNSGNDSLVTIYCKNFRFSSALNGSLDAQAPMPIQIYATGNGWMGMGGDTGPYISSNSVFSAKTLSVGYDQTGAGFGGCQPFTYAVGLTYCNGYIPSFPSGMIFVGYPLFDSTNVIASAYKGAIQHY